MKIGRKKKSNHLLMEIFLTNYQILITHNKESEGRQYFRKFQIIIFLMFTYLFLFIPCLQIFKFL